MSIDKRNKGFSERAMLIAVGLGAGMTLEQCAAFADVSIPTVTKYRDTDKVFMDTWRAHVARAFALSMERKIEFTKADLQREWEKRIGKALGVYDKGLIHDDMDVAIKAADRIFDRNLGRPTNKVETRIEGEVTQRHIVELPAAFMQRYQQIAVETLPALPAADVQDAEIVESSGS